MMRASGPRSASGFTLLEVLVAIAILGIGLTMILSSQVGLFSSASRGEHLTVAASLLRCRMSELEVELVKEGFPLIDQSEEGRCCGEEDEVGYRCAWKIERVELPQPSDMTATDAGTEDPGGGALGPLAALSQLEADRADPNKKPQSLQDIAQTLGSSAMASGMGPMVMGMVYPDLKPLLEASIRKVTVTVLWNEGSRVRELPATQYLTDPQQGGLDTDAGPSEVSGGGVLPGLGAQP